MEGHPVVSRKTGDRYPSAPLSEDSFSLSRNAKIIRVDRGMTYALVYLACLMIEFLYIRQTKDLIDDKIGWTMLWTGLLHTVGKIMVVVVVIDPWSIIPAVLGHVSGTCIGMWSKRMQR